jgi:hypothetical protein
MEKDEEEPLAAFIKRKGGINECVARYGRCLRRLVARRRSIAAFRRCAAGKRTVHRGPQHKLIRRTLYAL